LIQNKFTPLPVIVKPLFKNIREKENPQYGEHNKKLYQDYYPEFLTPRGQVPEPVNIKVEKPEDHLVLLLNEFLSRD
jgi:hypothetical protein